MANHLIHSIAESLLPGETERIDCPYCEGKSTLGITRKDDFTVLYQCFRASCDTAGKLGPGVAPATGVQAKPQQRRTWEGSTRALPQEVQAWIARKWGITDPTQWYYTDDYGGRIAMSILSPKGLHRGWVLRNDGSSQPKALTYVEEGEDALSWYLCHAEAPTVLVEDIPSAVRASAYVNAVALCGTGIGRDRASEIAEYATRPIVLALDQDAVAKSFEYVKRYSLLWDGPRILPLQQDIKDMQESDVCALLRGIRT